jgi:hypothetical protein
MAGYFLPRKIGGHVILWSCYSDSFADDLLMRGAKSVFGFEGKYEYYIRWLPRILKFWDELVLRYIYTDPISATEWATTTIRDDGVLWEVFHNATFHYKM